MSDLESLASLVKQTRAAVIAARVTAIELWRRAVLDGAVSMNDAREADARCAAMEGILAEAEAELCRAQEAAQRVRDACMAIREALASQGPLPASRLRDSSGAQGHLVHAALNQMIARQEVVRVPYGYALAS